MRLLTDVRLQDSLAGRFLRYSAIESQSDAACDVVPSSPGQWGLARLLAEELRSAGAADVHVSSTAVVTARVPATQAGVPAIGFCTHLDTADAGLSPSVRARVVDYEGGDLVQGTGDDGVERRIAQSEHPELAQYAGQRILVSDGTSVLGADDKAGVATVMELVTRILAQDRAAGESGVAGDGSGVPGGEGAGDRTAGEPGEPGEPGERGVPGVTGERGVPGVTGERGVTGDADDSEQGHGDIYLAFVPDEEIGLRGVRTLDLDRFPIRWAYTLDSCQIGEVVEETFNAATVTIRVEGVCAHPMSAKGVLVNPILVAHEVVALLDPAQTPERTQGREGYTWVHDVRGNQSTCVLTVSVRDHDREQYEARKARLGEIVRQVARDHPRARIVMEVDDVYANLADARTAQAEEAIAHVYTALERLGIPPIPLAMRGGTDGSWLSTQGIFTPNVFTGAHGFHSSAEFLPLPSFEASYRVCRELILLAAGH